MVLGDSGCAKTLVFHTPQDPSATVMKGRRLAVPSSTCRDTADGALVSADFREPLHADTHFNALDQPLPQGLATRAYEKDEGADEGYCTS
jgi:hypothetical protein